ELCRHPVGALSPTAHGGHRSLSNPLRPPTRLHLAALRRWAELAIGRQARCSNGDPRSSARQRLRQPAAHSRRSSITDTGRQPSSDPGSGAIWNPGEGWVDLPSLINFLAEELVGLGSELIIKAGA